MTKSTLRRLLPAIAGVWLLMPLTFVVPWLDSTRPPYADLSGDLGVFAHLLSRSGGGKGAPWLVLGLILIVVSRPGLTARRRTLELMQALEPSA